MEFEVGRENESVGRIVKLEKSKRRKRKEQTESAKKQAEKKQKRQEEISKIVNVRHVRNPHQCSKCCRHFPSMSSLTNHECRTRSTVQQQVCEDESSLDLSPYSDSDDCPFLCVRMGHGLIESREQNPLDEVTVTILERKFQEGVAKSSSRKGAFDMEQECKVELPTLLVHDVLSIGSWLSSRVKREKNANNSRARSADTTTVKLAKTDFDRKQDGAELREACGGGTQLVNCD